MEANQFEKLEEKIGLALRAIQELKRENGRLNDELKVSQEQVGLLRESLNQKERELSDLQSQSHETSQRMEFAGSKLQDLISRLDAETLDVPHFQA